MASPPTTQAANTGPHRKAPKEPRSCDNATGSATKMTTSANRAEAPDQPGSRARRNDHAPQATTVATITTDAQPAMYANGPSINERYFAEGNRMPLRVSEFMS